MTMTINIEGVARSFATSEIEIESDGVAYTITATRDGHIRLHAKKGERLGMRTEGPIASNIIDICARKEPDHDRHR